MTQEPRARRRRAGTFPGGGRLRIAAAAALFAVVIVGIRGANPVVSYRGPWHDQGRLIAIALEIVLAAVLIALLRRGARAPADAQPAARLRSWLRTVLIIGMIALLGAILLPLLTGLHPARPAHAPRVSPLGRRPRLRQPVPGSGHIELIIIYAALGLAALAVLAACVWLATRRRAAGRVPQADAPPGDDEQSELSRAVESGRSALHRVDDARAAIIACYVAMERSLAAAGAEREVAETPDELLARAGAAGLVHGRAAGVLTALFYEARFSSHPLPPERKQSADDALAALADELSVPSEAAMVGSVAGGPTTGAPATGGPATGGTTRAGYP